MSNPWAAWLAVNDQARYSLSRKAGWDAFVDAAPRPRFETLTRQQMARLKPDVLEDYTEARLVWNANLPTVRTQQLDAAHTVFAQVMASNRRDSCSLRGSVVLDALPGLGKTTAATRFGRQIHRADIRRRGPTTEAGHQRLPVAFISLSAGMTLKGLNQKLLQFYGHPAAVRSTRAQLGSLAVDCVLSCETRLVILDDLHFIDFKHRAGEEVSNHLKWLANEMPVTFIYIGVGLSQRSFFTEGLFAGQAELSQTSRRATRCPMVPFSIRSDNSYRAWTELLAAFEQHLALADSSEGTLVENAKLIYRRTQGYIASLTNLLDRAAYMAIITGTETITADILKSVTVDNAAATNTRSA